MDIRESVGWIELLDDISEDIRANEMWLILRGNFVGGRSGMGFLFFPSQVYEWIIYSTDGVMW